MTSTQVPLRRLREGLDLLVFGGVVLLAVLLPFHLVVKKIIPAPLGTYWKEILLAGLVACWALRCLLSRRRLFGHTGVDRAVLVYLGVIVLRFAVDRSGWVSAWGLYIAVMYLPLCWLVPAVLKGHPGRLMALIVLLVAVGSLVALGGLAEFAWDVALWPSEEMTQRQGFPSMYVYGTHVRRVYFTFDSPTTLANSLAVLLPLALALVLVSQRLWARLVAGVGAALMAACIVVTFSRGIWIATILSLVVMGVWIVLSSGLRRGALRRSWRSILVVGGAILLIVITWAAVWAARRPRQASTYEGVVEMSPAAYGRTPISRVNEELLLSDPIHGMNEVQTWSLLDPIALVDDVRPVLYQHPPEGGKAETIYLSQVPVDGALRFAVALAPEVWSPEKGDGASFQVYVADDSAPQEGEFVFVRYINPKHNITDRRWRNFVVDLSPWAGNRVRLSLISDTGPVGDWTFDWAGWAEPQIISIDPGFFADSRTDDAIVNHATSITDWVRDETNRDRLAAWSQSLKAWRVAPFWGTGLGSTGAAALRTRPESAYVTESQVLKALVELGPLGLFALIYLWFEIVRVGFRTYRLTDHRSRRMLLLGVLIGLLVIFVEGLAYQNLEVKQVNALFWILIGMVSSCADQVSGLRQLQ